MSIPAASSSRSRSARRSIMPKGSRSSPPTSRRSGRRIMVAVPRLFEVLRQRILKTVEKQGWFANYLMQRSQTIGAKAYAGVAFLAWDRPMNFLLDRTLRPGRSCEALRRADEGAGFGRGAAQPRGRTVLPVIGPDLAAGLRPDRGGAGDQLQPAKRRPQDGHGRPAAQEHRGQRSPRRRRDLGPRRAGDARILAQIPTPGSPSCTAILRRWPGCTPATSAISTPWAGSSSPTARRT